MSEHPNIKYIRRLRIIKREIDELIKELVLDVEQERVPEPLRKRATTIPEDYAPAYDDVAWAKDNYPEVDHVHETAKFTDYWLGNGNTKKNWDATWRNWIRQASKYLERDGGRPGLRRGTTIDQGNRATAKRVAARIAARTIEPGDTAEDPFDTD